MLLCCEWAGQGISNFFSCANNGYAPKSCTENVRDLLKSNVMLVVEAGGFVLNGTYTTAAALTTLLPLNGTIFNPTHFDLYSYPTLLTGLVAVGCGGLIIANVSLRIADAMADNSGEERRIPDTPSTPETPVQSHVTTVTFSPMTPQMSPLSLYGATNQRDVEGTPDGIVRLRDLKRDLKDEFLESQPSLYGATNQRGVEGTPDGIVRLRDLKHDLKDEVLEKVGSESGSEESNEESLGEEWKLKMPIKNPRSRIKFVGSTIYSSPSVLKTNKKTDDT